MHLFDDSLGYLGAVPEIVPGNERAVLSGFYHCVGSFFTHAVDALEAGHDLAVHDRAEAGLGCVNIDRQELEAAGIHLADDQAVVQSGLLLGRQCILPALVILHDRQKVVFSPAHDLIGEGRGADAVVGGIVGKGIVDLAVGDAQGHHDIGGRVRAREHIFDLEAGVDIPLRDIGGAHGLLHLGCEPLALSD